MPVAYDKQKNSTTLEKDSAIELFTQDFPKRSVPFLHDHEMIGNGDKHVDRSVLKVFDKALNVHYAVKVFYKDAVLKRGWRCIRQTTEEARILVCRRLNHPFVVEFISSWQSKTKLYLAMEYIPGGELFDLWKLILCLSHSLLRFIIAQVALAIDYLHSKSVIHRDLKMENMMFTETGYLKLIDFGASKQMQRIDSLTWTICGTLAYAAPEILNGNGYNYLVDWWAIGILFHALSCGEYPIQPVQDHLAMRRNLHEFIYTPPEKLDVTIGSVITRLLMKNPADRLHGIDAISKTEFFRDNLNFDAVEKQQYNPGAFFTEEDMNKLPDGSLKLRIQALQEKSRANHSNGTQLPSSLSQRAPPVRKSILKNFGNGTSTKLGNIQSRPLRRGTSLVQSPPSPVQTSSLDKNSPVEKDLKIQQPVQNESTVRIVSILPDRVAIKRADDSASPPRISRRVHENGAATVVRVRSTLDTPRLHTSYAHETVYPKILEPPPRSRSRTDIRFLSDRRSRYSVAEAVPIKIIRAPTYQLARSPSVPNLFHSDPLYQINPYQIVYEVPSIRPRIKTHKPYLNVGSFPRFKHSGRLIILRPS